MLTMYSRLLNEYNHVKLVVWLLYCTGKYISIFQKIRYIFLPFEVNTVLSPYGLLYNDMVAFNNMFLVLL